MSSHFRWYPSDEDTIVPFNARYSYPSQANKSTKITPRIPPKNGAVFSPGASPVIRLEFPAQGYVNPANTTIEFEVNLTNFAASDLAQLNFQNNIQSIFRRVRLLYGSTPIEDILDYGYLVRQLTEWTGTTQLSSIDQTSVANGIGGVIPGSFTGAGATSAEVFKHVRRTYIQGVDSCATTGSGIAPNSSLADGTYNSAVSIRKYQISLLLGLFQQEKLIPTKFMASQLAIEIELAPVFECVFLACKTDTTTTTGLNYTVSNINLIPEILEFDAAYDEAFIDGLANGGVPIKFASWHTFNFSTGGAQQLNLQIQERSRSVKALFACQRLFTPTLTSDNGTSYFATSGTYPSVATNNMVSYQYRIGGRYFPASPVICSSTNGGNAVANAAEAFVELQKCLNVVGDARLATNTSIMNWGLTYVAGLDQDYNRNIIRTNNAGVFLSTPVTSTTRDESGNLASCVYTASIDLETTNGTEVSGLNAEEQSDISFLATYSAPLDATMTMTIYSYFDAMIIFRENNVMELVQ